MSADSLILQALNITVIGMLIVFSFLILLIGMMKILAVFVAWMEKKFRMLFPPLPERTMRFGRCYCYRKTIFKIK